MSVDLSSPSETHLFLLLNLPLPRFGNLSLHPFTVHDVIREDQQHALLNILILWSNRFVG
jgi:hypothetical protein